MGWSIDSSAEFILSQAEGIGLTLLQYGFALSINPILTFPLGRDRDYSWTP